MSILPQLGLQAEQHAHDGKLMTNVTSPSPTCRSSRHAAWSCTRLKAATDASSMFWRSALPPRIQAPAVKVARWLAKERQILGAPPLMRKLC